MTSLSSAIFTVLAQSPPPPGQPPTEASWPVIFFFVFLALGIIVLALGLRWQLRRTRENAEHGSFGDGAASSPPSRPEQPLPPTQTD